MYLKKNNTQLIHTKKHKSIPYIMILSFIAIVIYGFVISYFGADDHIKNLVTKQFTIFIVFFFLSIFIWFLDIKFIMSCVPYFYILILLLLLVVAFLGASRMGAVRWINLGVINFQPSEFVKIAVVLMLAYYFHFLDIEKVHNLKFLFIPFVIIGLPSFLILKQPDLGTAVIIILVALIILFAVGVRIKYFIFGAAMFSCAMPIIWISLKDYQRYRIINFLNPMQDPLGSGYNIIQSKIAIGSGGFWGKGIGYNTQSSLKFLPEYHTDFVFAFLAEQLGFVGCFVLILLYGVFIFNSLLVAIHCKMLFARLAVVGIVSIFCVHVFVNIAMVTGILPVVGIPLPLMSYGGTSMVLNILCLALLVNIVLNCKNK